MRIQRIPQVDPDVAVDGVPCGILALLTDVGLSLPLKKENTHSYKLFGKLHQDRIADNFNCRADTACV